MSRGRRGLRTPCPAAAPTYVAAPGCRRAPGAAATRSTTRRHEEATLGNVWKFSSEGRRLQGARCPMGDKHQPDETWAQGDTFYCMKCGAIPKDSELYREEMGHPDAYFPDRL